MHANIIEELTGLFQLPISLPSSATDDSGNDSGREVIIKYSDPNLDSASTFHTDSNGRQMLTRVRDERSSFVLTDGESEPVASNYYPITTGESGLTEYHS